MKWLAVVVGLLGCGGTPAPPAAAPIAATAPRAAPPVAPSAHGATVRGRLLLNGAPVHEFAVVLVRNLTFVFNTAPHKFHAKDGRFALANAPLGTWDILIVGPGFARDFELQRELVADGVLDLGDINLKRGRTVRGTVTDAAGMSVANAQVLVGCKRLPTGDVLADLALGCFSTATSPDGRYVLEDVTKLDPVDNLDPEVLAIAGEQQSFAYSVPNQDVTIDLVVRPLGIIEGTVQGSVDRYTVVFARPIHDPKAYLAATVAADGSFRIERAPVGEYDIGVFSRGRGVAMRLSVTAGQTAHAALVAP